MALPEIRIKQREVLLGKPLPLVERVDLQGAEGIALAVRARTPIFVEESVLERAGVALETNEEQTLTKAEQRRDKKEIDQDNLDAYRDFINTLDVLDEFGKD